MGLPRLQSCCFVLDLKTGNIVLGCLNAVLSFALMVAMIVLAARLSTEEAGLQASLSAAPPLAAVDKQAALAGAYAMAIILVLMFLAKLAFDVLFVYGVVTERAGIIKAYFVMWVVFFLLSMFTFFLNVEHYGNGAAAAEVFYIGLNVYAILLSHSFYRQLNEREEL